MYNAESTIQDALFSCLQQTYSPVEIIVVDDGSTDNSYRIAKQMETDYARIRVYHQPRKGACSARNVAFAHATGDYIQYLDADDMLSPDKLSAQLKLRDNQDALTLFFCKWLFIRDATIDPVFRKKIIHQNYDNPAQYLIDSWSMACYSQTACWLTSRELIEKAGKWNESLLKYQDVDFFCRVILQAKKIIYSTHGIVYYRVGNYASVSRNYTYDAAVSALQAIAQCRYAIKPVGNQKLTNALLHNYLFFYSSHYPLYPDLLRVAALAIKNTAPPVYLLNSSRPSKYIYLFIVMRVERLFLVRNWLKTFLVSRYKIQPVSTLTTLHPVDKSGVDETALLK